ncbi:MAG: hypothetical protein DLM58_07310 [Pseudonocardiales bacterium]|nr:MAG: hypothetical protein DLM58_07310 [Pseudonocardiales bacterium]
MATWTDGFNTDSSGGDGSTGGGGGSTRGSVPVSLAARAGVATPDAGAVAVFAGEGTTGHRRDCALISHREDPRVMTGTEVNPTTCRVCRQSVG